MRLLLCASLLLTGCAVNAEPGRSVQAAPVAKGETTSAALVAEAWRALEAGDGAAVEATVALCRERYAAEAARQQRSLKLPVPAEQRDALFALSALNDFGVCLFILGQSCERQGRQAEAIAAFRELIESYPFAQCWDAKGWFWRPAQAAKVRLRMLEYEAAERSD